MIIALLLYAALCLLLLGIAVKLVMVAFRNPDPASEAASQAPEVPTQPLSEAEPPKRRWTMGRSSSGQSHRDDLVETLERQFHNSPSLSSNPEE